MDQEDLPAPGASNSNIVTFARAKREGSHVLISMEGTSGSGKTYSAIELGRGLVGPTGILGLLDTETGRGKIYADLAGGYEYGELTPPFSPERYIAAIKAAEAAGIQCLIIDSATHEWEGIGGLIEIADSGKTKNGAALEGLAKWAKPKARHKRFMQTLLTTRMHLIICLRVKEKLIQRENDKGKQEIVSAGWFPVQDKYFGYEMTVRLFFPDGGAKGVPTLAKCPADLLGAFPNGTQISTDTGARIAEWVHGGVPVDAEFVALKAEAEEAAGGGATVLDKFWKRITPAQRKRLLPIGPNLRSIAEEADREAAEEETSTGDIPSFGHGETQQRVVGTDF
jgi:hypothetical protein